VLHPQPVHIFRLWQIFLDNVNPVFKLFHAPSVQQRILDASADLQNASKSMHVLMFGIYTMSVLSLTDEDCMSYFNESKEKLSNAYSNGAKLALVQSKFMRNSDMTTLQGLMLYLVRSVTKFSALSPLPKMERSLFAPRSKPGGMLVAMMDPRSFLKEPISSGPFFRWKFSGR
jgi:hypothetical protein